MSFDPSFGPGHEVGVETSNKIIQKGLAFRHEQSVTVAATLKAIGLPRILPRRLVATAGLRW